jgi:NADPH:quinone reductase-like Zn-dependent oxidoreductase
MTTVLDADRFDVEGAADTMIAVVTRGVGGLDKLEFGRVARPVPGPGEVLLRVLAAGVNNTEVNARLGWYAPDVTTSTQAIADAVEVSEDANEDEEGWSGSAPFPYVQGADCCGEVVAFGAGAQGPAPGTRVLVRSCMRPNGFQSMDQVWMGISFDGAFAQYVKVPAADIFAVDCTWSDAELATIPCAYGTAENQLHRAQLSKGERVLITGASGGVGSASVQLAKRRGATVIAVAGKDKMEEVRAIGADQVLERSEDPVVALGEDAVDLVVDNVGGPAFGGLLQVLRVGGRYVTSGAIAGPLVELDLRTLYFKDQHLMGCTAWDADVFPNLVSYIERGEIRPILAKTFPLESIGEAQTAFLEKKHVGNFVLIPPQ